MQRSEGGISAQRSEGGVSVQVREGRVTVQRSEGGISAHRSGEVNCTGLRQWGHFQDRVTEVSAQRSQGEVMSSLERVW